MPTRHTLDCRQLKCPMPIVQVAMAIKKLGVGDELQIEASDPAFLVDLRAWSRMSGQPVLAETDGPTKSATVRKVQ